MCGFAGFIEFARPQSNCDDLIQMQKAIEHRGPNDRGHFFEPGIGLCHTRLSIVDLSEKAHQPMIRDNYTLVYNGEIFNFKELKSELSSLGYQFISNSDSEVLLKAYQHWGDDALLKFNGMFAFAILDKGKKTVVMARDRSGIKPLFYYQENDCFVFASEIKSLLAYPGFKKKLSLRGLEDYLRLGHTTGQQTIWQNCSRLPPGHHLKVDLKSKSVTMNSYWKPRFNPESRLSFPETSKQLKSLLIEEFERSLVSDVPVGACISGGVDSNVLISIITKELGVKLKTYSLSSKESQYDENVQAQKVADYLELEHQSIILDPQTCRESLLDTIIHYDEPFADQNIISFRYIAKAAGEDGVPVLLSGMGGDELFFGYPNVDLRAKMPLLYKIPQALRRLLPKSWFLSYNKGFKALHLAQQNNYISAISDIFGNCFFDDEIDELLIDKDSGQSSFDEYLTNNSHSHNTSMVEKILMCDYRVFLGEHGLVMADLSSMAEGIEMRVPFLNNSILEYSFKIPSQIKKDKGKYKALLREIENEYLPEDCVYKGKRGFYPFIKNIWLDEHFQEEMKLFLSQKRFRDQGLFHYKPLEEIFRLHHNSSVNMGNKIWNMLIFQVWADKNL